jgi:hypothetical protein
MTTYVDSLICACGFSNKKVLQERQALIQGGKRERFVRKDRVDLTTQQNDAKERLLLQHHCRALHPLRPFPAQSSFTLLTGDFSPYDSTIILRYPESNPPGLAAGFWF